jgi:F5/8 type C domain.
LHQRHPEQWIQIDLGAPRALTAIRLVTSQYPAGQTVHEVWVGEIEASLRLVHVFKGATDGGQELRYAHATPEANVRFIRIVTTESPSWVAWREIEISGG